MALKQTKPTKPRPDGAWARAPYNFVPLPEQIITAAEPLDHDRYHAVGLTGQIVCSLETCSPVYVRGMLLEADFRAQQQKLIERNKAVDDETTELSEAEKLQHAPFFSTTEEEVEGQFKPVIPGSSLRGMARTLVEIIGHGRMRWVADQPPFTFRAVASKSDDPLRNPYKAVIGNNATKVKAGYLVKNGDEWKIRPAQTQKEAGWSTKSNDQYIKVYDEDVESTKLPSFKHFDDDDYQSQIHAVSFKRGPTKEKTRWNKRGKPTRPSIVVGMPVVQYGFNGTLVCVGNMLETATSGKEKKESPRRKHIIILPAKADANLLTIHQQAVNDYLRSLTPFEMKELGAWSGTQGCLKEGAPVFYVPNRNGKVTYFGHCLNFRIPSLLSGKDKAATPLDFVPDHLRHTTEPDLADAIFGWVEEQDDKGNVVGPKAQRAGRVFFGDAHFEEATDGVWYAPEPITPHVLASPKPTTFQHYLVQDADAGHNPDKKASLAHYGTSPEETQIRGYKFYWHKGGKPDIGASSKEKEHESQLTRIIPLKPGVRFEFTVHFENLREEELGVLLWALSLPGKSNKVYRHKLGMGKPLGMGAVLIRPKVYLSQRTSNGDAEKPSRYERLFVEDGWHTASAETDMSIYIRSFETFMMETRQLKSSDDTSFGDLLRIETLLTMLEWREGTAEWLEETRYMEIERGEQKVNEYKERPVLRRPLDYDPDARPRQDKPSSTPQKPLQTKTPSISVETEAETDQPQTLSSAADPVKIPEVGDVFTDEILRITDKGDVVVSYMNMPPGRVYASIPAENVGGKQYHVGNRARCEVVEKYQEDGGWILVCKPGAKSRR